MVTPVHLLYLRSPSYIAYNKRPVKTNSYGKSEILTEMHADGDESICSFMPVAQRPPICVPSGLVL